MLADRFGEAERALETALAIRSATRPPADSDVLRSRVDLARVALRRGDVAAAVARMAAVPHDAWGSDFERLITVATRAEIAFQTGDLAAADAMFGAVAAGYARRHATHPNRPAMLTRQAEVKLLEGHPGEAAALAIEAEGARRAHLHVAMRDLSERIALGYESGRAPALDVLLSAALLSPGPEKTEAALSELTLSRALVFDELVDRRRSRADAGTRNPRLREALQAARSRWANLAIRGPGREAEPRYQQALAAARDTVEAAERAFAEESAEARTSAGTTLVSFVRYQRRQPMVLTPPRSRPPVPPPVMSYAAIIVTRDDAATAVALGEAAPIDRLVAAWRREASRGVVVKGRTGRQADRAYRLAGEALRTRVWDPLAPHLGGASRVLIVPDGSLQVVGFAALPVGADRYLADSDISFHYLTTERDVLRPADEAPAGRSLLAVGGVDFGQTASAPQPPIAAGTPTTRAIRAPDLQRVPLGGEGCLGVDEIEFPPLPATAQEARDVERMWLDTGGVALRLAGLAAREQRVRELAPQQRVLHFATHGFFLDSTCAPVTTGTRSVRKRIRPGGSTTVPAAVASPPASTTSRPVNPLALSGLAFANANGHAATTRGEDDGVLTAEEVATLDLHGVEWVVLSACDTGLGPIRAREGVLGLRRAFQVAGARTVIMSLWSVEDRTTRDWMKALYRSRLQDHRETIDSMRDANRAMLDARRAAGQTTHPYYWAGFVATGDWR